MTKAKKVTSQFLKNFFIVLVFFYTRTFLVFSKFLENSSSDFDKKKNNKWAQSYKDYKKDRNDFPAIIITYLVSYISVINNSKKSFSRHLLKEVFL